VFGIEGEDYCIYLADERELAAARGLPDGDQLDRGAGQPITGHIRLSLPAGAYAITAKVDIQVIDKGWPTCQLAAANDTDTTENLVYGTATDQTMFMELTVSSPTATSAFVRCKDDPAGDTTWLNMRIQAVRVGAAHVTQL